MLLFKSGYVPYTTIWWQMVIICILAYLFGSISFARIVAWSKKIDITQSGSGNPGTMNMIRTMGLGWGILTFLLDISKGLLSTMVAFLFFARQISASGFEWSYLAAYSAGLCAITGHLYPVFYKFRGGKGVATTMGVFLYTNPIIALISIILGVAYIYFREYGGIGSLIMIFSSSIITIIQYIFYSMKNDYGYEMIFLIFFLVLFMLITLLKHRTNLKRMSEGKENKTSLHKYLKIWLEGKKINKENEK